MTTTIEVPIVQAPSTPLNLQFGVTYAPRVQSLPLVGYAAHEVAPNVFEVWGYEANGTGVVLFSGDLSGAFVRLASYLRMDVAP